MELITNIYYTYIYLDPRKPGDHNYGEYHFDYEPFYVGKGSKNQIESHLNEAKKKRRKPVKYINIHKIGKINKILAEGLEPIRFKVKENLLELDAFKLEKELIKLIGRSNLKTGSLTNLTEGGNGGPSGIDLSIIKKGQVPWIKGRHHTEETKSKMRKPKTRNKDTIPKKRIRKNKFNKRKLDKREVYEMASQIKTAVLQNWFGVDQLLFGGNPSNKLDEATYRDYCSTKGAFLGNLHDIYKKLNYVTESTATTTQELAESACKNAKIALKKSGKIIANESVTKMLRDEVKTLGESDGASAEQVATFVVNRRRLAIALDSLVLESATLHGNKSSLKSWEGEMLLNSHKTLRDELVKIALS